MHCDAAAPNDRAAGSLSPVRSPARRRPDSIADQLRRCSDKLDRLQHDVGAGVRSAEHYHELAEAAEAIAAEIRAAFRTVSAPQCPPLAQQGGTAVW